MRQTQPHIAFLLPDGVGVRNCVLSPLLGRVAERATISVYHVIAPAMLPTYQGLLNGAASKVNWIPLRTYRETPVSSTLRYALAYAQMFWADTQAMRHNLKQKVRGSWRTKAMRQTARMLGRAAASRRGIALLDAAHCREVSRLPETGYYRELFQRSRPSLLVCSHQRPPDILPPVLAARSLGIPTATFIFSWDNLTSKGRIAAPFDHYLLWSEQMRRELLQFYPDIARERTHVVGTPQFAAYADPAMLWSREEFFRRVGADPARPLICYSGGDSGTCPEDHLHVAILMKLIRSGAIAKNPQVIVRPAPVDDGVRYEAVRKEFPEMLFAQPRWVRPADDWSRAMPLPEDVRFLANLTQHCDLNINVASTMSLDFALHDRPVVNIGFDISERPPHGVPLKDFFYKFEHYRPVVESRGVRLATSLEELAAGVNTYLDNPATDRDARLKLVDLEVGVPVYRAVSAIAGALERLAV